LAHRREHIKQIIQCIIRKVKSVNVRTDPTGLEKLRSRSGKPSYIWVSLYKIDGSLRWLAAGGWQSGNLIAVAEKFRNPKLEPIFVPNPEEVWRNIRLRYSLDIDAYVDAMDRLAQVMASISSE
jgi:hypothetical protein